MSIAIMTRLFKAPLKTANRKMLAIRLGDFADDEGRGIWPSVGRLSTETELSERTVQRLLQDFVTEGLLIVVKEGGGGRGTSTRYDFDLNAIERLFVQKIDNSKGDTVSPLENVRVTTTTVKGDNGDSLGCHGDTQTVIEPLDNPPLHTDARECEKRGVVTENFTSEENPNSAAFQKRVIRFCNGTGFRAGAWKNWDGVSLNWIAKQFAALTLQEREQAERWRDAYLLDLAARKSSPQPVGVFLRDKAWEILDEAILRRAEHAKAADAARSAAVRKVAAPYGKMWGIGRMVELLAGAKPTARPSRFIESMILKGGEDGEKYKRDWLMKAGYPLVVEMHEAAKARRGYVVDERYFPVCDHMEQVFVGSEIWVQWRDLHEQKGWLWFDESDVPEWVWFPAGGVEQLNDFKEKLSEVEK